MPIGNRRKEKNTASAGAGCSALGDDITGCRDKGMSKGGVFHLLTLEGVSYVAMQAATGGFIIGVVQDSVETALNSSGDVFFTATAEVFDRKGKGE